MKWVSAKDIFLDCVVNNIEKGHDIVLVTADLSSPALDSLREKYPDRYVSVGIAEQNLIAVASGIALSGSLVVAYAANPFTVTRAYDQIRSAVALMNIPLCIVGVGTGLGLAEYGPTHYVTEDIALMSMCPHMQIYNVSTNSMAEWLGNNILSCRQPTYIRLDRMTVSTDESRITEFNSGVLVHNAGSKVAIVSSGYIAYNLWSQNQEFLRRKNVTFIEIFKIPFEEEKLLNSLRTVKKVVIIDENNVIHGLSSFIYRLLNKYEMNIKVVDMAINYEDAYPSELGDRFYMLEKYGLSWNEIEKEVCR